MSVTMLWLFPLAAFALISTSIADQAIDKDIVQDEAHLKEHLKNKVETSGPTTAEKQRFRWFWITDLNHDGYLDGIEIMKSLTHSHDHSNKANIIPENAIEKMVDTALKDFDIDLNGLIDFAEFQTKVQSS